MDAWQHLMRQFVAAADDDDFVQVASLRQAGIAAPPVGVDHTAGYHGLPDEGNEAIARHIHDASKSDAANAAPGLFRRDGNDGLGFGLSAPHSHFRTADIDLVDFDSSGKAIPTRPDHRSAQLVEPGPGCLIASQAEYPLQAQGAHTVLLAGHEPHCEEPRPQRFTRVLKYRAGSQRRASITDPAPQQSVRHNPRFPDLLAMRADKAIWPSQAANIVPACCIITELLFHLLERPRIVYPRDRISIGFHPLTVSVSARSVKGIPILVISAPWRCVGRGVGKHLIRNPSANSTTESIKPGPASVTRTDRKSVV